MTLPPAAAQAQASVEATMRSLGTVKSVLSRGDVITVADVPPEIRAGAEGAAKTAPAGAVAGESLADAEKRQILAALERAGGNRSKAADELGINRRTLHRKLAAWGVAPRRGPKEAT